VTARRPRSVFRRAERWFVGIVMAVMVFVLERLVIRQIQKKEQARLATSPLTVGEE